jgi:hypothetical protein
MTEPIAPSNEMTEAAFSGPALAISNFMIHPITPNVLRLSFVESPADGSNPQYRTAVILTPEGARNLAELLLRFAPPPEAEPGG